MEKKIMEKHDLISSTILFCVGLFIVLYSPQFDLGNTTMPRSGFMPFLTGILMCIFSIITFFQAYLDKSGKVEKIWANIRFRKLVFVLLMLLIYTLLLEKLGFIICTFFMILILIRFVGPQTWLNSFLVAGLTSIISYLLFETWLKAQLPKGILGF